MQALNDVLRRFDAETRAAGGVVWGRFDCLHLVLEAAAAAGGRDLTGLLPAYDSERTALVALKRAGFDDLTTMIAAHGHEVPAAAARAGAIVLRPADGCGAFGVVVGAQRAFFIEPGGGLRRAPFPSPIAWSLAWPSL